MGWRPYLAVPKNAHALRPWRMRKERAVHFTATSFVKPYSGCEITIRRMDTFGMIADRHDGPLQGDKFVDVLAENGDILETFEINRNGFEYLRQKLGSRREDDIT